MSDEYREKLKSIGFGIPSRRGDTKVTTHTDENGTSFQTEHFDPVRDADGHLVDRVDVDIHPNTVHVEGQVRRVEGSASCGAAPDSFAAIGGAEVVP